MLNIQPEYIIDQDSNKKSVVLSIDEWEQVVARLEELEDIKAYDAVKRINEDTIPFAQVINE